jgi:hypothetical protein
MAFMAELNSSFKIRGYYRQRILISISFSDCCINPNCCITFFYSKPNYLGVFIAFFLLPIVLIALTFSAAKLKIYWVWSSLKKLRER